MTVMFDEVCEVNLICFLSPLLASCKLCTLLRVVQQGVPWLQEEQSLQEICHQGDEEGGHDKQKHGQPRCILILLE